MSFFKQFNRQAGRHVVTIDPTASANVAVLQIENSEDHLWID